MNRQIEYPFENTWTNGLVVALNERRTAERAEKQKVHACRQTDKHRQEDRQTVSQTDRQTDGEANRKRQTELTSENIVLDKFLYK